VCEVHKILNMLSFILMGEGDQA